MEIFYFLISCQISFSTNNISKFNFVKKINEKVVKLEAKSIAPILLDEGFIMSRKIKVTEK